jgi:hypothetical protein
MEKEFVKRETI